jgi:hypothetical protein
MDGKYLYYNGLDKNFLKTTRLLLNEFGCTSNEGRLVSQDRPTDILIVYVGVLSL